MKKVLRGTSGKVARRFGRTTLGDEATPCCCHGGWWILVPCGLTNDGWWNCGAIPLPFDWPRCRWISHAKYIELDAEALADGATGPYGMRVYDSRSEACYWIGAQIQATEPPGFIADGFVDYSGWVAPVNIFTITQELCCPEEAGTPPDRHSGNDLRCGCDDDGDGNPDPDPPVDPPPPPPDPDPTCTDCGIEAPTPGACTFCSCTPAHGIRAAFSGLSNCPCVGPCGVGPSYKYSRIKSGWSPNGVFDLNPVSDCVWRATFLLILETGAPADPGCLPGDVSVAVTVELRKLSATLWVCSMYVNDMDPTDPREFDATTDTENWRFFIGEAVVPADSCMSIPSMSNGLSSCACRATATSDGRFDLCTLGAVSFTVLCP